MKKSILITLVSFSFGLQSFAKDSKSYFKIGVGYHWPTMQQEMPMSNGRFDWVTGNFMESVAPYSMGKGLGPAVSFGHMFNANIGFEVGVNYLFRNNSKAWQGIEFEDQAVYDEMKIKSNNLNLYPSIRLAVPVVGKVSAYTRTGLVIPILSRMDKTMTGVFMDTTGASHNYEIRTVIKNRFNVGFSAALGVEVKVSDNISVTAEVAGQMLNLWTKSEKLTKFEQDGQNSIVYVHESKLETQYVKEVESYYLNGGGGTPMPAYGLSTQNPFHSIGLNIGVSFGL